MKRLSKIVCVLCFAALGVLGQTGESTSSEFIDRKELVHFGDLIDVDIVGSTDFDWRGRLTPEGFLAAPLYDSKPVYALCRSTKTIAQSVADALSKFLRSPTVRVKILDKSKRPLAVVTGAVGNPQRFRLKRPVRLSEILVVSGGFASDAGDQIEIIRNNSSSCGLLESEDGKTTPIRGSSTIKIKVNDILAGMSKANPEIHYGDFVLVRPASVIYVIGAVGSPGKIRFSKGLTASRAINSSGGSTSKDEVVKFAIFRRNRTGTEVIEGVYEEDKNDSDKAVQLLEYDIVEVFGASKKASEMPPVAERPEVSTTSLDKLPVRNID